MYNMTELFLVWFTITHSTSKGSTWTESLKGKTGPFCPWLALVDVRICMRVCNWLLRTLSYPNHLPQTVPN